MRKTSFYGWQIAALWTVRSIFLAFGLTWPAADALSAADQDNGVSGYFRNWFALVDEERPELSLGLRRVAALGLIGERRLELLFGDEVLEQGELTDR